MMAFGENLSPDFDWGAVKSYVEFVQVVQERFPSWAWALDDPELGPLLREAASSEEWSPAVFESQLKATRWWNDRTAAQREWDIFVNTAGEAEVQDRIAKAATELRTKASALGVTIGDDDAVTEMATRMLRDGWSDAEITANLASLDPNKPGDLTAARTMINGIMSDYMVSVDEATAADFARKLVTGEMTGAGITEYARNLARQR
ncbi:MAG: hypothetical protein D6683_12525 [Actinomyces sp.]|nr:MAG: hypothetical protein D6683_12525 [Actinomyces sp.]